MCIAHDFILAFILLILVEKSWAMYIRCECYYRNLMHVFHQVGVRLSSLGDAARGNKAFLDEHTSAMECVTKDAKRKWEIFAEQTENDGKVGSSSSAAKHCRMETMLQEWYV